MHESFLAYQRGRYFYIALALVLISIIVYIVDSPLASPNGGTWLGYTLGTIGALIIVWLILFGVRKRNYTSTLGTLKGWLSAHVYLGTSLLIVATLHSGFQVGWNIHTLAYILMIIVILSGFIGIYFYIRYPSLVAGNRSGQTREQIFAEVITIDRQAVQLADKVDTNTRALIESAAERTEVGGSWFTQLTGHDRSKLLPPADMAGKGKARLISNTDQQKVMDLLNQRLAESPGGEETSHLQELLGLIARKRILLSKARQDIKLQGLIQLWLYLHIPLSFALLGALVAHILSVFVYW